MLLKITSTHKTDSNADIKDIFIGVSELYISIDNNKVELRTKAYTEAPALDEEGNTYNKKYPVKFLESDPLFDCINQTRGVEDYAVSSIIKTLTGTEYSIMAQLLYEMVLTKFAEKNTENPDCIAYQVIS